MLASDKEINYSNMYRNDQNFQESGDKYNSNSFNTKNSKTKSLTRLEAHDYENKIQDLNEKIEILENKLRTSNEQKAKILNRLKDNEEDVERMRDQIARQASHNQKLNEEVSKHTAKISELSISNKNINEKCKTKFEILNKELEDKEEHIDKIIAQVKAKEETIKYYSVNNEQTIRSQNLYKEELEKMNKLYIQSEEKIKDLERTIDNFYINRKSEAGLLLEIEHLKDDNIRLLKMLKSTDEYKDFAYLAETVTGGIKFIGNVCSCDTGSKGTCKCVGNGPNRARCKSKSACKILKESNHKSSANTNYNSTYSSTGACVRECDKKRIEKEDVFNSDNWVPADAFNCAYEFKSKYNIEISESLINDLLSSLNKIWRDREQKQISRLKTKYQNEIMGLRRKVMMRSPYDEFESNKKISKLKKDLRGVKDDLRNNIVEKNRLKSTPSGIDLVDNALKVAANFQKTKKVLENEINTLKNKLHEKEDFNVGENFERLKFNEGSFWMRRVLQEMENLDKRIDELYREFEERTKNVFSFSSSNMNYKTSDMGDFNNKILSNSKKWFNQSYKDTFNEVIEKFEKWHFDIQTNFESLKF